MVKKRHKGYFKKTSKVSNDIEIKKVKEIYNSLILEMAKRKGM